MFEFFKRKKDKPKHDIKYDKKSQYLGISIREYVVTKPDKIEKMGEKMRESVDKSIKNSKKKNDNDLKLMYEDVKKIKRETLENENVWSRWSTAGDKAKILYSEYDRLINSLNEELEKREVNKKT
ncbi:MAG: hypothetical protein WD154_00010 [Nitrosopumilaceae archaeon]